MAEEESNVMSSIRVIVAEDNFYTRTGTVAFLESQPGIVMVGHAVDGRRALALFEAARPDVVVLDRRMPELDGLAVARALKDRTRIVMLTQYSGDEDIHQALSAGAHAYLSKESSGEELVAAIRAVHAGQSFLPSEIQRRLRERCEETVLTNRERQVLAAVADGASNREVGQQLQISDRTVAVYVSSILTKLGAASRTEAVSIGIRRGLLRGPEL
jgi:two-component system NarL family response regulator